MGIMVPVLSRSYQRDWLVWVYMADPHWIGQINTNDGENKKDPSQLLLRP